MDKSTIAPRAAGRRTALKLFAGGAIGMASAGALPVFAAAASPVKAPAGSPVARHGALAIAGGNLVGSDGRPVTLRGMSLFWSQWSAQWYNPETVAWLVRDWKISLIRVAVAAEGNDSAIQHEARELAKARTVIDAAIAAGIYVIVDWHAHQPSPDAAASFLTKIAAAYRGVPNLIYEPWNEPLQNHGWADVIKPAHLKVIPAIRAIDPAALVVAGTRSWSQDVDEATADPLPFANVAYTLHYYAATHKDGLRAKGDVALGRGFALFVTEYGTVPASGDGGMDVIESQIWWDWMETRGISYANWSVHNKAESASILLPTTQRASGWASSDLTPSGKLVRAQLRSMSIG